MIHERWHYLDHAATTPMRPEALDAMVDALKQPHGNPSGAHVLSRRARTELDCAREDLADVVGCQPGEVVFTSGGTEADNLAVRGVLGARPGVVVCSAIEHHAVLQPVEAAGGRVVPVGPDGVVDLEALAASLDGSVVLLSVGLVNNEIGTIQPLDAIAKILRQRSPGALLHTDAAQALTWLDVREHAGAADLVTLASHKCGGPVGTGALVVRSDVEIEAQQLGGGQERDRRSGTQDVAGALAFAAAAVAAADGRAALVQQAEAWRDHLVEVIQGDVPDAMESAVPARSDRSHLVAGVANLCFPAVDSEALLFLLEQDHRILASAASSCASGAQEPSHVLAALGIERRMAGGSLRLSLGWSTAQADVDAAIQGVPAAVHALRAHSRNGVPA
jgi:cysteine desulfurase